MYNYYHDLFLNLLQILLIGESNSGKTSLVQSLVDQQSRVTSQGEETIGVDMYDIEHEIKVSKKK